MIRFRGVPAGVLLAVLWTSAAAAAGGATPPLGASSPIQKLPNGGRPEQKIAFPAIADWNSLRITLRRTTCYGTCPGYSVEIDGDGTVKYHGGDFVAVAGDHRAAIPSEAVHALFDEFAKADFFWTFDEYRAPITDLPAYTITLAFDGRTKMVLDYGGDAIGMPEAIGELEDAIDGTAVTKKWVDGDDTTFTSLEAEHWDFRARDDAHLSLIASAAMGGNAEFVKKLLMAGVDPKTKFGCKGIEAAAYAGKAEIVNALTDAGAPIHWDGSQGKDDPDTCDALRTAALSGMPRIVRTVLGGHPDVNWQDSNGTTALMQAAGNASAEPHKDRDYAAVVKLLIDAGADVNLRDSDGESAIMKVHKNAEIVRALLAAGATDINAPMRHGKTAIMRSYDAEVTQALLDGGADPWIVDKEGKNALEVVDDVYGPANPAAAVLKRWMAEHPKRN